MHEAFHLQLGATTTVITVEQQNSEQRSEPLNLAYHLYRQLNMMCHFLISYAGVVLWTCMWYDAR